ncbi:MAG TPA: 2-oxoglutarate dehydrogenase complex dihydrolipoyllysine-residue succinyltransferase, partial [Acidobacteria bacterium]|nr:2-oxoglutarate dehydrogenase complex dihydrolipoyllysine-residue succinyltransferase [Acidobacteriota bacterium]
VELKIPSFGESITDVVLGAWLIEPGQYVAADDPVVVIETDKVTAELPAPVGGVLKEILKQEGESAQVGDVVGLMEEGPAPAAPKPAAPAPDTDDAPSPTAPKKDEPAPGGGEVRVMPAAARALADAGLDAEAVEPSGPGGRLLKEDVVRHGSQASEHDRGRGAPGRATEAVTMTPMRRRIAERLVSSQQQAALLTTFNQIDMSHVIALRAEHKQAFLERYGVKLGFMSFFVKAAIEALKVIPELNARIEGEQIIYHHYYDIGVAIGGGRGLVVPVLRNAERMSFAQVEQAIGDFAQRAKNGKLTIEELQGGTFTISNGGVYGSLLSTPIVNPPQSGILGLHAIEQRPVAIDGQVVIRPMMYVALTYDHRIVDGREAVTFLKRIKECVENPSRILLEI